MPRPIVHVLGIFIPILREVGEMLYQWDEPFVIDDSRFRTKFGTEPTDVDEAARKTATWVLDHYKA